MQGKKNERPGVQAKKRSSAVRSRNQMIPRWVLSATGGVMIGFAIIEGSIWAKAVLVCWGFSLVAYALAPRGWRS